MSYVARLNALDFRQSYATPARSRIALLTGQSSFYSSHLSAAQSDFLSAVAPPHAEPLFAGFPYHPVFGRSARASSLVAASVCNGLQVLWCLTSPSFRGAVTRAIEPLFALTSEKLYLVTGSCGLQLLAAAWPALSISPTLCVTVVSVGPALLRSFTFDRRLVSAVQGRSDIWSRLLYRGPVAVRCRAGHLGYWQCAETRGAVARLLARGDM